MTFPVVPTALSSFNAACLRADLTTLLSNFDLAKASRVAEALLAEYVITPRRRQYGRKGA